MRISREIHDEVLCPSCGTLNLVTYRYSGFDPANQERQTAHCAECGKTIARAKCFSIGTMPMQPRPDVCPTCEGDGGVSVRPRSC
jgi:phage FluMu protein Com